MSCRAVLGMLLASLVPSGLIPESWLYQAGRKSPGEGSGGIATLNVIVDWGGGPSGERAESAELPISRDRLELYDAGILQPIEYFRPDYSPARIVILVDNSETLRATVDQLRQAVLTFINQLYEGDQAMLVAFSQHPEVLEEFTPDKIKLKAASEKFTRAQAPRLLDAIQATLSDALRLQVGITKRVIILLSDGYDWDSGTTYQEVIRTLQRENVVFYAVKLEDRTRGASRRKTLKPEEMLSRLTSGTGGRILEIKQLPALVRGVMKEISEDWYQLSYRPQGINPLIARRLLLLANDRRVRLRTKSEQPPERM